METNQPSLSSLFDSSREIQQFLDEFTKMYLKPLNQSLLADCSLVAEVPLTTYNNLVGKTRVERLKHLPSNQAIWGILLGDTVVSVLHLTYINDCMLGAEPGRRHILQWSYSFTSPDSKFLRQGFSKALRLASMLWGIKRGCSYINSVPFPGAYSNQLLISFGFTRFNCLVTEMDYYIYHLTGIAELITFINEKLSKYKKN